MSPKIDQRTYEEIVDQTTTVVEKSGNWKAGKNPDPGSALIRIFSRMVHLVSDRLNRVPEKNFLAFLELVGGQLQPPQSAKVPLTFSLAEGSPNDGFVPAYTQVSATIEGQEVIFETDQDLVVTTSQLKQVWVCDPEQEKYSDRTLEATGKKAEDFPVFIADTPIDHSLYINCPEIFALPNLTSFTLNIETDTENNATILNNLSINWSYWQNEQWNTFKPSDKKINDQNKKQLDVTFNNLPTFEPSVVDGKKAIWIKATVTSVKNILPPINQITATCNPNYDRKGKANLCLFNDTPLDLSKPFYPFGETPTTDDQFQIALADELVKAGGTVTLKFTLNHSPQNVTSDLSLIWEISNGKDWQTLDNTSQFPKFTESKPIGEPITETFTLPPSLPSPRLVEGEPRYWIRGRIVQGHYGKPSSQRQYYFYDDITILTNSDKEKNQITVNNAELLQTGDTIRLQPNTGGFPEDHKINKSGNLLTLDAAILNATLPVGTRVLRQNIVTETIPPTYDPPKIESINLSYSFILQETATYTAYNHFNRSYAQTVTTKLKNKAFKDQKYLNLVSIEGLEIGEFILIGNDNYQIEAINPDQFQMGLISPLNNQYEQGIEIKRYFRPFLPIIDQKTAIYLGFDQPFTNTTITLYLQISPLKPNDLDPTEVTKITEDAEKGTYSISVETIRGWQKGDRLTLANPEKSAKLDNYTIVEIENSKFTLKEPLKFKYKKDTLVLLLYITNPQIVWQYANPLGWERLGVEDETKGFSQRGTVRFIAPTDLVKRRLFGQDLYWLRVCWQDGNFRVQPRLNRILTNTTWASQAISLHDEILGSSNEDPRQVFTSSYSPILEGQQLMVNEGKLPSNKEQESLKISVEQDELGEITAVWVTWQEVTDFYQSGSSDRHYTLDRQSGKISFGDGKAGKIPPRGQNNLRLSFYRTGGGKQGNIAANAINQLKSAIPYIDSVINLEVAAGGSEQETLTHLETRVPKQLRHRDRAVTLQDIEDLAYEASNEVARVKVIPPELTTPQFSPIKDIFWLDPKAIYTSFDDMISKQEEKIRNDPDRSNFKPAINKLNGDSGQVRLIILPNSSDPQPVPSLALLERVANYLRSRCPTGMEITVIGPSWQPININTTITPVSLKQASSIKSNILQQLAIFLHPITGKQGKGWPFGRYPQVSDLYALIQSIEGVDRVNTLEIVPNLENTLAPDCLIYSGHHTIKMMY